MATAKTDLPERAFQSAQLFTAWLAKNHATCTGIWLRFAKKDSGLASVTPQEAIEAAICFGWIDGQIQRKDGRTYLVRYGPRAKRSIWSKINRERGARPDSARTHATGGAARSGTGLTRPTSR